MAIDMKMIGLLLSSISISFLIHPVRGSPVPVPKSSPDPNPQFQPPPPPYGGQSSQTFSMYKPIQLQYGQGPGPGGPYSGQRQGPNGSPLFAYNYNITHPSSQYQGDFGPGGIIQPQHGPPPQSQSHIQFLTQTAPNQQQLLIQSQRAKNSYSPVIITNPGAVRRPQEYREQQDYQRLRGDSSSAQFYHDNDLRERDPEENQVGFRIAGAQRRGGKGPGGQIVFDQRTPTQQFLEKASQHRDNIVFSNGQRIQNQLIRPTPQPLQYDQQDSIIVTPAPPIHVPYITTPSALQRIMQLQKNPQSAIAGFRSQLGFINPLSLQTADFNRNAGYPAVRTGRVQNFIVPYNAAGGGGGGQTPVGTQLLQQDGSQRALQELQNAVANNAFALQRAQNPYARTLNIPNNPNLTLLRGTAITPENQGQIGQFVFTDPNNPNANPNTNNNNPALIGSSAQKLFILPPGNLPSNIGGNALNYDETPSEIIITVVDDDVGSSGGQNINGEKGNILTNFSLFLVPSTYKKCVEGYRKAHDGKCRLIIKLRSRRRG